MKVYIGPYKNLYISPLTIADLLKYVGVNEKIREKIAESYLQPVCQWVYNHTPFKDRKVKIRVDNHDLWCCSETLAHIILPMLKRFKEHKHSFPAALGMVGGESWDPQQCFDFYSEETEKLSSEMGEKRWDAILDKMIFAFESIAVGDWNQQYCSGEVGDIEWIDEGNGLWDMVFTGDRTWDWEAIQIHQEKIDEGLKLFAQYLETLGI